MEKRIITGRHLADLRGYLDREERAGATREKYLLALGQFSIFLAGRPVTREEVNSWKEELCRAGLAPGTVNGKLAALNSFFAFMGWDDLRVKYLKVQRRTFRDNARELTREEYERLLRAADGETALIMESICATGIRVSEVKFLTVEAAKKGRADVSLKGKIRTILIPKKLARKLLDYAKGKKITRGEIFLTPRGKSLGRGQIWARMKRLCRVAKVAETKVFPHNLRHLFARAFYKAHKDVVRLADVLGHSSIETTRIYLITTGAEHARQLERLGLIS